MKDDTVLHHYHPTYVINSTQLEDEGMYTCSGWSSDGIPTKYSIRVIVGAGKIEAH